MNDAPALLPNWTSPYADFLSSVRPAFRRSQANWNGEIRPRLSHRAMMASAALHIGLLSLAFTYHSSVPRLLTRADLAQINLIPAAALPSMDDAAGNRAGNAGSSGGAHRRGNQRIKDRAETKGELIRTVEMKRSEVPAPINLLGRMKEPVSDILSPPTVKFEQQRLPSIPSEQLLPSPPTERQRLQAVNLPTADAIPPTPAPLRTTLEAVALPQLTVLPPVVDTARIALRPAPKLPVDVTPAAPVVTRAALPASVSLPLQEAIPAAPETNRSSSLNESRVLQFTIPSPLANAKAADSGALASISAAPGDDLGKHRAAAPGLDVSPSGGIANGIGEGKRGSGLVSGSGVGAPQSREGTGASNAGAGPSNSGARVGVSSLRGPGGAGRGGDPTGIVIGSSSTTHTAMGGGSIKPQPMPGLLISVASVHQPMAPQLIVVSTAGSGGALRQYANTLKGKVYTTYLDTSSGIVVLEYANASFSNGYDANLLPPQAIQTKLPELPRGARAVMQAQLGSDGVLTELRVLEDGLKNELNGVLLALKSWRFTPVVHGSDAVPVTVLIGIGIHTD